MPLAHACLIASSSATGPSPPGIAVAHPSGSGSGGGRAGGAIADATGAGAALVRGGPLSLGFEGEGNPGLEHAQPSASMVNVRALSKDAARAGTKSGYARQTRRVGRFSAPECWLSRVLRVTGLRGARARWAGKRSPRVPWCTYQRTAPPCP